MISMRMRIYGCCTCSPVWLADSASFSGSLFHGDPEIEDSDGFVLVAKQAFEDP